MECQGFYVASAAAFLLWWAIVRRLTKRHLYQVSVGSVQTRPRWISASALLALLQYRRPVFLAVPIALLAAAALGQDSVAMRVVAALIYSLYHLMETSVTCRHGEYPVLSTLWALALPDAANSRGYAKAAALGVVIHFILSSGVAKVWVGGGAREWTRPATMRTYLNTYRPSKTAGPISPIASAWVSARPWALTTIGGATLLLEIILVPATLLTGARIRAAALLALVAMHVGIALLLSKQVGIAFLTSIPAYAIGFCGYDDAPGMVGFEPGPWFCAVAVGLGPTALAMVRGSAFPLPEEWPCSPISLFMFSGRQASQLSRALMTGSTRVVLLTKNAAQQLKAQARHGAKENASAARIRVAQHGFVGRTNAAHAARQTGAEVAHDAVLRTIGFTLLQGGDALLSACPHPTSGDGWCVGEYCKALGQWLRRERRLTEVHSGRPLLNVAFVDIGSDGCVDEVLELDLQQPAGQ